MTPPFEQTLIKNSSQDYLCVIQYLGILLSTFGEDLFQGRVNRNHFLPFFHFLSSPKMPVGVVLEKNLNM